MLADKKFYQMALAERLDTLNLSVESRQIFENTALEPEIANNLIENQISEIEIPLGLCFITVDGKAYTVPMATEEPSVIAAANNGAKLASDFITQQNDRLMNGQIVFYDVKNGQELAQKIEDKRTQIFKLAESSYPSIYKRGGGLKEVQSSVTKGAEQFLNVEFFFDTKDAMGANIINTILEQIAQAFRTWFPEEKILFAILSNDNFLCKTIVECRISIEKIGLEVARKIALASDFAQVNAQRTATHNKGIMNGVEAVILATGNDSRAVNTAAYIDGVRRPLASWKIKDNQLIGEIKISLPLATAGGATHVLPKSKATHELLGNPDSKTLATITAAVGLANNLAALKALVTKGIQAGHMSLQARSLALAVGAKGKEIDVLTQALKKAPHMDTSTAELLLQKIKNTSVAD